MNKVLQILFLTVSLFVIKSGTANAKNNFQKHSGIISQNGYILKTDLIPLFNTILEKNEIQFNLGLEACFNKCYSLQTNFNYDKYKTKNVNSRSLEPGLEIRWYTETSDITFFHLGLYSFYKFREYENIRELPDKKLIHYKENFLENGIAGGFRIICIGKLEMDIATYIGYVDRTYYHLIQSEKFTPTESPAEISSRITLSAAFHF